MTVLLVIFCCPPVRCALRRLSGTGSHARQTRPYGTQTCNRRTAGSLLGVFVTWRDDCPKAADPSSYIYTNWTFGAYPLATPQHYSNDIGLRLISSINSTLLPLAPLDMALETVAGEKPALAMWTTRVLVVFHVCCGERWVLWSDNYLNVPK